MAETWLAASGAETIPTAFLVDKQGMIAWFGHPMELSDATIEQVLAGTYDRKQAAAEREKRQQDEKQISALAKQLETDIQGTNWAKAEATVDQIEKLLPAEAKDGLSVVRVKILAGEGKIQEANKLASQLSNNNTNNARLQHSLAWEIISTDGIKPADLDVAERAATRANDITEGKEPIVVETLARVYFLEGKKDKALDLLTHALAQADGDRKEHYQKALDSYKADKLPAVD